MPEPAAPRTRNATETKERILAAAQALFARKGYAQCGIKEIADAAQVAPSLVIKHFGSKADLLGAALLDALRHTPMSGVTKSDFSKRLTSALVGKTGGALVPALTMAALDDEEARKIAAQFTLEHVLKPSAQWLGAPQGEARAAYIMMVSFGFAVFMRLFEHQVPGSVAEPTSRWIGELFDTLIQDRKTDAG